MKLASMNLVLACVATAGLFGCQAISGEPAGKQARATLDAKSGSHVAGHVDFSQAGDQVLVTARVSGLKPNSEHGFHVHEKGDCSAPDAASAGEHFNPDGHPHGHPSAAKRHAGDMYNLVADSRGEARTSFKVSGMRVAEGAHGILNRALVVHVRPDDYTSQPSGDAGDRIACGVIKPA